MRDRRAGALRRDILRELREIRIDMARFNDELSNITSFSVTGTVRIYEKLALSPRRVASHD
jgi:hypothetical protein